MRKYAKYIKKPYNSTEESHEAHYVKESHLEGMPRWSFCGDGYFPESPIRVVVRQIKKLPEDYEPHIDLHTHDVDELYIVISEEEGGLEVELTLGDEVYQVTSPATIYLPKDLPHKYAAKRGRGFIFTLVPISCAEQYNQHTFPR